MPDLCINCAFTFFPVCLCPKSICIKFSCSLTWFTAPVSDPYYYLATSCYCCGASVASEQQHKQDLRRIYKREYNSRIHHFLPECIAPFFTRMHCAFYQNALRLFTRMHCAFYQNVLRHEQHARVTPLCCRPFSRGLQLIKVRYGLL